MSMTSRTVALALLACSLACQDDGPANETSASETAGDGDPGDGDPGDGDPGDGDGDGDGDECFEPDRDDDGHAALDCGGDDCDDDDPNAYPGYPHDGWEQQSLRPWMGGNGWKYHTFLTGPDELSDIVYAFNGTIWHIEQESQNVWDGGTVIGMGSESRAAFGPDGQLHVVFAGPGNNAFGVFHSVAGSGVVETIEEIPLPAVPPFGLDLAIDESGGLHVVYGVIYQFPPTIRYATSTGDGNWASETITDNGAGFGATVVVDGIVPHVSFSTNDNEVMHASKVGGWTSEVVAAPFEVAATSLAIDGDGELHMAFSVTGLDDVEDELHYVRTEGGSWIAPELIDTNVVWWDQQGEWDYRASVATGPHGQAHVAYHDHGAGMLRYATRINGVWTQQIVDQGQAGWYAEVIFEGGLLHFGEGTDSGFEYRRYSFSPNDGVDSDCNGTVDG